MISKKLQRLSRLINELTGVPLFAEIPSEELNSLGITVIDEDSLRARVADLCNLIDRINKKNLDRFTCVNTKGSRECFINVLKKLLPRDHNLINKQIDQPLGMILLLRAFLTHRKNKAIDKALQYFGIPFPIENFKETWEKVLFRFNEIIDQAIEVLSSDGLKADHKQTEIDEQLMIVLMKRLVDRYRGILNDGNVKKLLLFIMSEGTVVDTDLSSSFGLRLSELRELLLPLVPGVLSVSFHDSESTNLGIKDHALPILKEFYFGEKRE